MRCRGADCLVVARKRSNVRGAKRQAIDVETSKGQLVTGGARGFDEGRQPFIDGTSRMNREVQVRICEGLGVKFRAYSAKATMKEPTKRRLADTENQFRVKHAIGGSPRRMLSDDTVVFDSGFDCEDLTRRLSNSRSAMARAWFGSTSGAIDRRCGKSRCEIVARPHSTGLLPSDTRD